MQSETIFTTRSLLGVVWEFLYLPGEPLRYRIALAASARGQWHCTSLLPGMWGAAPGSEAEARAHAADILQTGLIEREIWKKYRQELDTF
jgi:hypothetical protein